MPRSKRRGTIRTVAMRSLACARIAEYVGENYGSLRDAAAALGLNHSTLHRAVRGLNARGPSVEVCTALADHSGKPTDYFFGRGE